MPFKSEKQRKYLWANEPEIARDWTDTYGSKIHKADGGIMRRRYFSGAYGQGAGDRGGDPHASAAENRAAGSGAANERAHANRGWQTYAPSALKTPPPRTPSLDERVNTYFNEKMPNLRHKYNFNKRGDWIEDNRAKLIAAGLIEEQEGGPGSWNWTGPGDLTSMAALRELQDLGYTGGFGNANDPRSPNYNPSGESYIYPPTGIASVPIEEEVIETASTDPYAGSYRVQDEYLVAEGGRVPAAFGGIMDSYTGRRAYGIGSSIKKAFKKATKAVKKLVSSDIGKLAMLYGAGTYLGGTQAFGGTGWGSAAGQTPWKKFGAQLLSPTSEQGIGNLVRPRNWSMFQETAPITKSVKDVKKIKDVKDAFDYKDALKWIVPTSVATGVLADKMPGDTLDDTTTEYDDQLAKWEEIYAPYKGKYRVQDEYLVAEGGRIGADEGGLMNLGGMEKDYRNDGGFVPLGGEEKADDVPARLSKNEFVFTADAVRNAGGGDIDKGAEVMENVMKNLEAGGKVSEESQGQGAQEMFEVSERLSEVV